MSVSVPSSTKFRYEGNGVTDTFAYDARVFVNSDLAVDIITRATDIVEETLSLTTHYSVTIDSDGTASVTVVASKIPSSLQDILLRRVVEKSQPSVLPTGTVFPAKTVETGLDRVTVLMQDIGEELGRSLKLPINSTLSDLELPTPESQKIIGWNIAADELVNYTPNTNAYLNVSPFMETVLDDTTAAEVRATIGAAGISSSLESFKNKIINGSCAVGQRGAATLSGAFQIGKVDRMLVTCTGSGLSGSITQGGDTGFLGSTCISVTGASFTSGNFFFRTRLESSISRPLNGKTVTIGARVFHNFGSATPFIMQCNKANSIDDFTFVTNITSGSNVTCNNNAYTDVSHTFTFSSTDCNNGIDITLSQNSLRTASGVFINAGNFFLVEGTSPGVPEVVPFDIDLLRCQRYYEKGFQYATVPAQNAGATGSPSFVQVVGASTSTSVGTIFFKVRKRVSPTITLYNPSAANAQIRNFSVNADFSASTVNISGEQSFTISGTTPGGSSAGNSVGVNWQAACEL